MTEKLTGSSFQDFDELLVTMASKAIPDSSYPGGFAYMARPGQAPVLFAACVGRAKSTIVDGPSTIAKFLLSSIPTEKDWIGIALALPGADDCHYQFTAYQITKSDDDRSIWELNDSISSVTFHIWSCIPHEDRDFATWRIKSLDKTIVSTPTIEFMQDINPANWEDKINARVSEAIADLERSRYGQST